MVDLLLQKAGMSYYNTNVYYKSWRDSRYRYGSDGRGLSTVNSPTNTYNFFIWDLKHLEQMAKASFFMMVFILQTIIMRLANISFESVLDSI